MRIGHWPDWEFFYSKAKSKNFFLSPYWGKVIFEAFHFQPRIYIFDGKQEPIMLPAFVDRKIRGILWGVRSMPLYHYGGLLSSSGLEPDILQSIAAALHKESRLHTLIVSASPNQKLEGWEKYRFNYFDTHVLDLSRGFEHLWGSVFKSQQRNRIQKAQTAGLKIQKDKSRKAVNVFYELYETSRKRWGRKEGEPRAFFEKLLQEREASVDLWLAFKDEQAIAGLILGNNETDTVYYLYGSSDEKYWEHCPNNLLFWEAIKAACQEGYKTFDFLPSARIPSLERFKESFGAERVRLPEYWIQGRIPNIKRNILSAFFKPDA